MDFGVVGSMSSEIAISFLQHIDRHLVWFIALYTAYIIARHRATLMPPIELLKKSLAFITLETEIRKSHSLDAKRWKRSLGFAEEIHYLRYYK